MTVHQGLIFFEIENNSKQLALTVYQALSNSYVLVRVCALHHHVELCLTQRQHCHTLSLQYTISRVWGLCKYNENYRMFLHGLAI